MTHLNRVPGRKSPIYAALTVVFLATQTSAGQIGRLQSLRDAVERKVDQTIDEAELPARLIDQTGVWAFNTWLATVDYVREGPDHELAERVLARVADAAMSTSRFAESSNGLSWEVAVIRSNVPNAVAFPGGKVGINTGLLDFTGRNEDWLAVALSHEAVHALARHAQQRMNAEVKREIRLAAARGELSREGLSPAATAGIMVAMGVAWEGTEMRPLSREHELEADLEGLLLLARAGYNPLASITFWEEMGRVADEGLPEFLSTHPSYETRIEKLNEWMSRATAVANEIR